tara:strand:- start:115 stop:330 length:216 start_codon:yes stop_codon:yes gene_type:complete
MKDKNVNYLIIGIIIVIILCMMMPKMSTSASSNTCGKKVHEYMSANTNGSKSMSPLEKKISSLLSKPEVVQ